MFDTGPRQGPPLGISADRQLAFYLVDVPSDPVQTAIHVGHSQPPWLAYFPDQQEGEQLPVKDHRVDRGGDPFAAFRQADLRPRCMLIAGMLDGAGSDVALDTWRPLDRRQVDRGDMVAGHSHALPLAVQQVADAVGLECLRCHRHASGVGLCPRASRF
jgi:hypothetical protein